MICKHCSELKSVIVLEISIFMTHLSSYGTKQLGLYNSVNLTNFFSEVEETETANIIF